MSYSPRKARVMCEFCLNTTTAGDGVCRDCSLEIYALHQSASAYVDGPQTRRKEYRRYKSAAEKCVCPPATRIRMRKAAACYDSASR